MSEKVFGVYLAKEDPESDAYAKLDLPARPWELLDALDKLHLQEGDRLYLEIDDYYDFEELATVLHDQEDSLVELNDLAERLTRLSDVQCAALQGLIQMETAKDGGEISVSRLRDLTESTDCCHVVPEALNDSQLGRFYAENGFVPEVEGISDTVFELLDFAAIGLRARKEESGVFTRKGYVLQNSDLKQAPSVAGEIEEPDYMVLLEVSRRQGNGPAQGGTGPILAKLPAAPEKLEAVVERLNAASSQELWWRCIDCVIPEMRDAVSSASEIKDINRFAQTVAAMPQGQRKMYKAVLEGLRCNNLPAAIAQADTLNAYTLNEEIYSPSEFAKEKIRSIVDEAMVDQVLTNLNLYRYGETLMESEHCIQTGYGLLQRRDGQEPHIQDKHIGMMEMRR